MTDKEKAFCIEYLNSLNPTQAALKVGYSKHTAKYAYEWFTEMLKNTTAKRHLPYKPYLKDYIDEKLKEIKSRRIADATEVIECFTSIMRDCDEPAKNRLRAGELLGKYYNLFAVEKSDKTEILDKLDKVLEGIESEF